MFQPADLNDFAVRVFLSDRDIAEILYTRNGNMGFQLKN